MAVNLWNHQLTAGDSLLKGEICALWWEPRCGKTLAAIHGTRDGDRLIVCPSSVKPVWEADLALYGDNDTWIYTKKFPTDRPRNVIINYESLWRTSLLELEWDSIIFDESHRLSNHRTKLFDYLYRHIKELCDSRVILLSGTPCPEGYHQLITQSIIATGMYNNHTCPWEALRDGWIYEEDRYKWIPDKGTDKKAKEILHMLGQPMTRQQAGINTVKLYRRMNIELTQKEYTDYHTYMAGHDMEGAHILLATQSLVSARNPETKDIVKSTKLDAVVNYAVELNQPVVIFAQFTASLKYIHEQLKKNGLKGDILWGGDDGANYRAESIHRFNKGFTQYIVAQIQVAKVGLNLSKASTIIFAENSFSAEARIQAEERCTVKGKDEVEIVDFLSVFSPKPDTIFSNIDTQILEAVRAKKDFNTKTLKHITT